MALTGKQLGFLRGRAHPLAPRLTLGKKGITDGFVKELDESLTESELVKIRLGKHVKESLSQLGGRVGATLVQNVGRSAVFYRAFPEPVIKLPSPPADEA
jgi:RNA-binding protein